MSAGMATHLNLQEERDRREAAAREGRERLAKAHDWCARTFPEWADHGTPHPRVVGVALTLMLPGRTAGDLKAAVDTKVRGAYPWLVEEYRLPPEQRSWARTG